ncbi:MAG TPA: hypothetical protein VIU33_06605, partial [Nitrospiria bacterium]
GLLIVSLERGSALDAVDFMGMAVPAVEEQGDNFWKGFVFQTIAVALIKKGLWIGTPVQLQRAEEYYSLVQNETGRKKTILNLAKILSEQVALLKNAKDADAAAAVLMKTERGKDNIPLNKAYKSLEGGKVFSGMDTVLLLERESERVLALSYIARNLTIGDQADRAFKLASIWDDPLIRFIVFANIAKGRILTVQDPKRNLLKILEGK